jgi:hypothetical protein
VRGRGWCPRLIVVLALKMDMRMLVPVQATQCYIPEDSNFHNYCCENLKFYTDLVMFPSFLRNFLLLICEIMGLWVVYYHSSGMQNMLDVQHTISKQVILILFTIFQ